MDLDRCRVLLCAIETGSLTAAAESLRYTPSGVSRMIAALEEETGFPLLVRERSGVRPTENCLRMLPAIRELVFCGESCSQLAAKIRGVDEGTVTIGTAYSAYYLWLAQVTSAFHQRHPGIQVQIISGYSTQLLQKLEDHQADLCIISQREGDHSWTEICQDALMGWVPAHHPLAEGTSLPVSAYAKEPCIETFPGEDIDNARVFQRCGIRPNIRFSTMDSYATYAMVEAGLGISMNNALNGWGRSGAVKIMPLDPPQTVSIGIASSREPTPAAETFLHFLQPHLQELSLQKFPLDKK